MASKSGLSHQDSVEAGTQAIEAYRDAWLNTFAMMAGHTSSAAAAPKPPVIAPEIESFVDFLFQPANAALEAVAPKPAKPHAGSLSDLMSGLSSIASGMRSLHRSGLMPSPEDWARVMVQTATPNPAWIWPVGRSASPFAGLLPNVQPSRPAHPLEASLASLAGIVQAQLDMVSSVMAHAAKATDHGLTGAGDLARQAQVGLNVAAKEQIDRATAALSEASQAIAAAASVQIAPSDDDLPLKPSV